MYQMSDLLLQMAYGTAWELPTVSSGTSSSSSGASSFQTLLEQRKSQESASSAPGSTTDSTQKTEGESEEVTIPQTQDESQPLTLDLAAFGAALLMEGQAQTIVTPEAAAEEAVMPVVQPLQTPVLEETGQTESILPEAVPQEQLPQASQTEQAVLPETAQLSQEASQANGQTSAQPIPAAAETDGGSAESLSTDGRPRQEQTVEVTQSPEMTETPVFQKVEHLPIKVGETVTVDTTAPAQEMEVSLSKALADALRDGGQRLEIQLSPANLGTVTAEFIRSPEGALQVVLRAESPQAAKLLSDHAGSLGLLLQESTRTEVRVDVPQPQQNQQLWQENRQGGQQQQQSQQQNQQPRQETESFLHQLRLGLLQMTPSGT